MKILILTGHFFPELHPRAFRANELACEFSRNGHDTNVAILRSITNFDYKNYQIKTNLKIQNLYLYSQSDILLPESQLYSNKFILILKRIYRLFIDYFLGGSLFINAVRIKKNIQFANDFDLVISLSTPFMNHLGMALIRKQIANPRTIFVADSGDPFYRSQQTLRAPYFYFLEKYIYKKFDFLTVPSEACLDAYKGLIEFNKIKIIPQGFNLENIRLGSPRHSEKIIFAYSGVFYLDIRNPEFLLKTLVNLNMNFRFDIYLRRFDESVTNLLNRYIPLLGEKLNITYGINRDDLLYRLSTVDFLINIDNLTINQIPSKLIDYAITKRPIYSCNSTNFCKEDLIKFMKRDYSKSEYIDVSKYDIKIVANQFIELVD